MFAVCSNEFKTMFKSIRSIIIIIFIVSSTVLVANLIDKFAFKLQDLGIGDNVYVAGLTTLLYLLGPLFVTSISHNLINKETYTRRIRFVVTKVSRDEIIMGKFFGVLLFWVLCLFFSLILILPLTNSFYIYELIKDIIFISYFVSLTLLLSSIINSQQMTMFLGVILSVIFPILSLVVVNTDNMYIKAVGYLTPYPYFNEESLNAPYLVLIFTIIFLCISLLTFRRKDL